jgi:hypothetical protein
MRIVFYILTLIISLDTLAQNIDTTKLIIDPVEYQAEFPGGVDSLWCFFESHIDYKILNSRNLKGKIYACFVIDTCGSVSQIETNPEFALRFKGILKDDIVENEIKRVIALIPKWKPATSMDKKVKMRYSLPVNVPYLNFKCARLSSEKVLIDKTELK